MYHHHHTQTQTCPGTRSFCAENAVCPKQILVIDRVNGPAHVLLDTLSLLYDREVSVTLVDDHTDALRALDYYHFDVILVGLENQKPIQLTILPSVQKMGSEVPLLVVGRTLPAIYKQYARTYGADEVLNLPERAADLKQLVARLAQRYLVSEPVRYDPYLAC